jgi:hypothetical protein
MAARAQTGFVQLQTDVEQLRKSEIEREWQRLRGSAEQAFAAADARVSSVQAMAKSRAAATSDKVTAQLTSVRGSLAKGRKQFEQASAAGDLNAARTAAHTVTDVNEALDLITPAISGASVTTPPVSATLTIPDALKTAAEAFFAGRYEDVAKLLGGVVLDTMPTSLRVHAYTIRSASLFARYEYSNRQELSLQQAARADADASRRLDPAFRPNPAAFAPKFLAFYSETASASR